jgi:predicted ATPase
VRPLPHPEKARGIEGLHASLIGRDEELARLRAALAAVRDGEGQVATIVGDAGVGKSRLIAELQVAARAPVAGQPVPLWLEGRCLDLGLAVSYGPFLDVLRTHFALSPEEDERARGNRIAASVRTLVEKSDLTPASAEEMLPVLGHLLSARFGDDRDERLRDAGPEQIKHQSSLALRDLVLALAQRHPVVLILEDLHWADSLSLDLIALLLDSLPHAALFLVCAYRPDRAHRCLRLPTLATRKCPAGYTELHLRELSPQHSRRLLESLLPGEALPAAIEEQVLLRAQGNPFFVEEMVRSLIDAGLLYHAGGVWRARAEIGTVALPETVQSVILSRVDRLDGPAKHVLQCAAVIGRLFRRRVVGQMAQSDTDLERTLWDLEERQLIYQERATPEDEYSFQHALIQETIYHNMLRRHRTQMHRAVAEALERLYGESLDGYYEQLAHHFEQAGVVEQAIEYQLKAGEKARRTYLHEAALTYFQQALAHLEGSPLGEAHRERMLAVLHELGMVLRLLDRLADAESCLRRAIALGHELHQPARAIVALYYMLGDVLFHQGRGAEEVQCGKEGLALLGHDTESTEAVLMYHNIGHGHELQGHLDQYYAYFSRIARLIKTLPYSIYWSTFLWSVEVPLAAKDVAQAVEIVHHAELVAQHHSADLTLAGAVRTQRAQILFCSGDFRGAVAQLEAALDYFARTDSISQHFNWSWLAEKCLALGDLRSAAEYAERVRSALPSEAAARWVERNARQLGTIALCAGAVSTATTHLEAAVGAVQAPSPLILLHLGRAYLAQGRREEAARQFEGALAGATQADWREGSAYSPYVRLLPNALSGLEEASGSGERVRALVERLRHESPLAPLLPLVPCPAPATVGLVPPQCVHEAFTASLSPAWTWHDPFGDCTLAVQEGLQIAAANGRDLWHVNLSAPRLLRPAPSGDWAVQALCAPASDEVPAIGGLLLWQDPEHYQVLERGRWGTADISLRRCWDNEDRMVGRGWLPGERTWLRLERRGTTVRALCSADGTQWWSAGECAFPAREGEQVGMHAIGLIDRTIYHGAFPEGSAIRFQSFDLWIAAAV